MTGKERQEKLLNDTFKHYVVKLQVPDYGVLVLQFTHAKSSTPNATPLLFSHGWPGSFVEASKLVGPLSNPKNPNDPPFHVVAPSITGFVYSSAFKFAMKYVPLAARMYRILLAWELEKVFYAFLMTKDGARMRQRIRDTTYSYIENDAPPEYREVLRPDCEPGCKRRVNTATYLAALHSPNMHLAKDNVTKIGPRHVETASGATYPADAIIYATGFATQKWLYPLEIKGENGLDLHQVWDAAGGAEAYKGTVVTGFPNFFILYGPNAATGQHSVIFKSECQINYTCRLLRPVLTGRSPAASIMVRPEAQRRDLAWVHEKLKNLVFNSGCQSWWMDPKMKKNTFIYPDPMFLYWLRTIFPRWCDFEVRRVESPTSSVPGMFVSVLVSLGLGSVIMMALKDSESNSYLISNYIQNILPSLKFR